MAQYAIYLRKSRADGHDIPIEETIQRHENMLLETAKRMKLSVVKIYREVVSGESIAARPQMQLLLDAVDQGLYDGVLVVEIERLARGNSIDQGIISQSFQLSDTKIITPIKTIDPNNEFDSEALEFGLFMSRREYKTINRRLQRGRLESVKEGKYVGNKPPYGYTRIKLTGQKGYTLEPHPDQADIVKLIYNLYTTGTGMSLIVRKLNNMKVPTATGGDWVLATIRGILSNPVYTGKIRWNYRPQVKKMIDGQVVKERPRAKDWMLFDGLHPAIIRQHTYDLAQRILAENPSTPAPRQYGVKNPLAGLVVCGKCGRKMVRRPYLKRGAPDTLMCPVTSCNNVSSQLSIVEDRLLQALAIWLDKYTVTIAAEAPQDGTERDLISKAAEALTREVETLQTQLSALHDLLERCIYDTDTFLSRSKLLNDKLSQAKADKVKLEDKLEAEQVRTKGRSSIVPAVKRVIAIYRDLQTVEDKNKLLKEVLEKAVYTKEISGRWHAKPDDFKLVLYPKLPR